MKHIKEFTHEHLCLQNLYVSKLFANEAKIFMNFFKIWLKLFTNRNFQKYVTVFNCQQYIHTHTKICITLFFFHSIRTKTSAFNQHPLCSPEGVAKLLGAVHRKPSPSWILSYSSLFICPSFKIIPVFSQQGENSVVLSLCFLVLCHLCGPGENYTAATFSVSLPSSFPCVKRSTVVQCVLGMERWVERDREKEKLHPFVNICTAHSQLGRHGLPGSHKEKQKQTGRSNTARVCGQLGQRSESARQLKAQSAEPSSLKGHFPSGVSVSFVRFLPSVYFLYQSHSKGCAELPVHLNCLVHGMPRQQENGFSGNRNYAKPLCPPPSPSDSYSLKLFAYRQQ